MNSSLPNSNEASSLDRARSALKEGDLDHAILEFTRWLEQNPSDADGYLNRGIAFRRKGDLENALSDHGAAIGIHQSSAGYYNRGNSYGQLGEFQAALDDFNAAIRISDRDFPLWIAYKGRADCFFHLGNFSAAVAGYHEVIRQNPGCSEAYFGAAKIWAECPDVQFRNGARAVEYASKAQDIWVSQNSSWKSEYAELLIAAFLENRSLDSAISLAQAILKKQGLDGKTRDSVTALLDQALRKQSASVGYTSESVPNLPSVVGAGNMIQYFSPETNEVVAPSSSDEGVKPEDDCDPTEQAGLSSSGAWPSTLRPLKGCNLIIDLEADAVYEMPIRKIAQEIGERIEDSNNPNAWYEFARDNDMLSPSDVVACFQRPVLLDPYNPDWWYNLACRYELEGKDWYGAANAFNHVVFLRPDSAASWYSLANLWSHRGFQTKAREYYDRYLKVAGENPA